LCSEVSVTWIFLVRIVRVEASGGSGAGGDDGRAEAAEPPPDVSHLDLGGPEPAQSRGELTAGQRRVARGGQGRDEFLGLMVIGLGVVGEGLDDDQGPTRGEHAIEQRAASVAGSSCQV